MVLVIGGFGNRGGVKVASMVVVDANGKGGGGVKRGESFSLFVKTSGRIQPSRMLYHMTV